jgi:hypothetical protein
MVGGKVIGLARREKTTLVHVQDRGDTCSVRVVERRRDNGDPITIDLGDAIWWQMDDAMWTPAGTEMKPDQCGKTWDIILAKVGYLH